MIHETGDVTICDVGGYVDADANHHFAMIAIACGAEGSRCH